MGVKGTDETCDVDRALPSGLRATTARPQVARKRHTFAPRRSPIPGFWILLPASRVLGCRSNDTD